MFLGRPDRNLILTGYIGPNQPVIGQTVAQQLKMRFVNIEVLLETRGDMDIDDMRARYGETRLKMLETEVMQEVLLHRGAVIQVSGQTLLRTETTARVQANGLVLCLVVRLDAALQRMHLALGGRYHNPSERALAIGHLKSEWAVRKSSGVHELDVTNLHEAEMIEKVCSFWEQAQTGLLINRAAPPANGV
ncbi:MAG: shikimate kinase [Anaerolineae bacterium]